MKTDRCKLGLMALCVILFMSVNALGDAPTFTNLPVNFTIDEDAPFEHYVMGIDPEEEYPLRFSTEETNLTSGLITRFEITNYNSTTGFINFTPLNEDVGNSSANRVQIIVKDTENFASIRSVLFTVLNVNDPPNITQYYPAVLMPSIVENDSIGFTFNYSASDEDLLLVPSQDNLSNTYYYEGQDQTMNESWHYVPNYCEAGTKNVTLVVYDLANLSDSVTWLVQVNNSNRLPVFNASVQNQTWEEDTNYTGISSLDSYFYDEDTMQCNGSNKDNLSYTAYGNSSIRIIINPNNHSVTFVPAPDFFGTELIYFEVSDGTNTTTGNYVLLNVTNVNDAPVMSPISNQTVAEYSRITIQINGTDADFDALVYSDNSTLFNISSTGLLNYTASEGEAGNYSINISVSDGNLTDSFIFVLEVLDNHPPAFVNYSTQYLTENAPYTLYVEATDYEGDAIEFTTNSSIITISNHNATAGLITKTPSNSDVGNYSVLITATDSKGASNNSVILFVIQDINNPPTLSSIGSIWVRVNNTYTNTLYGSDVDGDTLYFGSNSTLFSLQPQNQTTSLINFTPTLDDVGNYSILFWVNDTEYADTEIVGMRISVNVVPELIHASQYNATEDNLFTAYIYANDEDNDQLSFSFNTSMFTATQINSSTILINFTPEQQDVGNHSISINVSDGYGGMDAGVFTFSVAFTNDTPYFSPPLSDMTAFEDTLFTRYIYAEDEEGDELTFADNSTLFNLTAINRTTALINFTPGTSTQGNYSIRFSVSDGGTTNNTIITLNVRPTNSNPQVSSYYPSQLNVTIDENSSQLFNISASDPDNDTLSYTWSVDGVENQTGTNFSYSYITGFFDAGIHNISVLVSDGWLTATLNWSVNVTNVNRAPTYGVVSHSNNADFSAGTLNLTSILSDSVVLDHNASGYYPSGSFNSTSFDLKDDIYLNVTVLTWSGTMPKGTNVSGYLRTSNDRSSWTNWTGPFNASGSGPSVGSARYVQYKLLLTSNSTAITPEVHSVDIQYIIANYTLNEKSHDYWIDLDDYFTDPDTDDNLTYNFSVSGTATISIEAGTNIVSLYCDHPETSLITFNINDGYTTTYSHNVTVVFRNIIEESEETQTSSSSSSSSSSTTIVQTRMMNNTENKSQLLDIEILVPGLVTIYENETMEIPITVNNNDDKTFKGITISAATENKNITLAFTQETIDFLEPGGSIDLTLFLTSYRTYGSYGITLTAHVEEPDYTDTVKFFINSLEKGAENRSQLNTKIAFTRDLLQQNPECLELNELLIEAQKEVDKGQFDKAQTLISTAVDGCRYLITQSQLDIEMPDSRSIFGRIGQWFSDVFSRIYRFVASFF